jgi:hypothetical protein
MPPAPPVGSGGVSGASTTSTAPRLGTIAETVESSTPWSCRCHACRATKRPLIPISPNVTLTAWSL